jgi:ligand-binding SRPBCC domain-containing protein
MMMPIHTLCREQVLDAPPDAAFAFFADPLNLEAIMPPLLRFAVVTPAPIAMGVGTFIQYRLRLHGVPALDGDRTLMRDTVGYALGFGPLGALAHRLVVRRDLEAIFAYRARRVPRLLS